MESLPLAAASPYRPNPNRSLFISGKITGEMLNQLTPEILRLQAQSTDPITIYIDSFGGSTQAADDLLALLTSRNQDGKSCRTITVATSSAYSAAADLLSSGNYALAYPHTTILFHGVRSYSEKPMTTESAASEAERLKRSNERYALQLARRAFHRFVFRYILLRDEFSELRKDDADASDLKCFSIALRKKLSPWLVHMPSSALETYERNQKLFSHVTTHDKGKDGERTSEKQARLLKLIIDYELTRHTDDPEWVFDSGLVGLQQDFLLLDEFFSDEHVGELLGLTDIYQEEFLTEQDKEAISKIENEEERTRTTKFRAVTRMHPLWYFLVSLCRNLQEKDNFLSPRDAYWLGLIDEIIGVNDLPSVRRAVEFAAQNKSTVKAPGKPSNKRKGNVRSSGRKRTKGSSDV